MVTIYLFIMGFLDNKHTVKKKSKVFFILQPNPSLFWSIKLVFTLFTSVARDSLCFFKKSKHDVYIF